MTSRVHSGLRRRQQAGKSARRRSRDTGPPPRRARQAMPAATSNAPQPTILTAAGHAVLRRQGIYMCLFRRPDR
jgi:hypothetical protein